MKKTLLIILIFAITLTFVPAATAVSAAAVSSSSSAKVDAAKIEKVEEDCSIKIFYPVFSGFNFAKTLNTTMQDINLNDIGYIRNTLASLQEYKKAQEEAGGKFPGVSIDSSFDYNKSGDILSVVTDTYEYGGGAHGYTTLKAYTLNTKTGEMYSFSSLFKPDSNYKKVIIDKIEASMNKDKDMYFDDAKKTVESLTGGYKFYIDGDRLVIYFDLYEIVPYAAGIPKFVITAKELKGLLKDDIYNQMINAKRLEKVRLNGTSMPKQFKTYEQNYSIMVPLKTVAETLGYKVTWDSKKGAGVAGGYIKNNVDTYYTTDSKKIKLTPAKIIGNVMYVPFAYFSEVLKEDVNYDYGEEALKIFTKPAVKPSQFDIQSLEFTRPATAKECAEMYAKASQERKGVLQYGLFSEKLRAAKRADFEGFDWVTGVSSPWISDYDIKDNGKGDFTITFHWATSTGKSPDSTVSLSIEKAAEQDYYEIASIK